MKKELLFVKMKIALHDALKYQGCYKNNSCKNIVDIHKKS